MDNAVASPEVIKSIPWAIQNVLGKVADEVSGYNNYMNLSSSLEKEYPEFSKQVKAMAEDEKRHAKTILAFVVAELKKAKSGE